MSTQTLSQALDLVEQQFNEVAVVLAQGQPEDLPVATATLQQLTIDLLHLIESSRAEDRPPSLLQRIKILFESMSTLRAALMRRLALVEQTLKVLLPTPVDATYAEGGAYGSVPRGSGAFKVLAA